MGLTKQKLARLKILDKLLSSRYHHYSTEDLAEEVSRIMVELDPTSDGIIQRTIQKDIKYLREEWPEFVDIEEYKVPVFNKEKQKTVTKHCVRYANPGFSLFKKELSDDEIYLLNEALSLLGQFDGLPNLEALEGLRISLGVRYTDKKIISFTKNPIHESSILGELFTAISHKQVIELRYHKFNDSNSDLVIILHPYLLKEYNRRWYLFASTEDGKLLTFGLERILSIASMPNLKYQEYEGDINERFEDIIGITLYEDAPLQKIYFWVSAKMRAYIDTKPLHESQRGLSNTKEYELSEKYPSLIGGKFYCLECKRNPELIRELTSFGEELIVLEPTDIQESVVNRITLMQERYKQIKK